jgi:hypothetical protein
MNKSEIHDGAWEALQNPFPSTMVTEIREIGARKAHFSKALGTWSWSSTTTVYSGLKGFRRCCANIWRREYLYLSPLDHGFSATLQGDQTLQSNPRLTQWNQ